MAGWVAVALLAAVGLGSTDGAFASSASGSSDQARAGSPLSRVSTPRQGRVFLLGLRQRGNPGAFASEVSDPSSRLYRKFLSLREYQARFATRRSDRRRVLGYLTSQPGVIRTELSSDMSVVLAILTPPAGQRIFCARGKSAPTRGLCIPPPLRGLVRQISAGELYRLGAPAQKGHASRGEQAKVGKSQACPGAAKTHAFTPQRLSTAYGADRLHARGLDGSGVRVVTLSSQEVGTAGFRTWARCFGLPTPVVRQFAMPGASLDTATDPDETILDVEALAFLAPRLQRITPIFVPLNQSFSNSFLLFMFGALDPSRQGGRLPDILSISDGVCESRFTRAQLMLGERMLTQAAALGITTLAAAGDLGFLGCFSHERGAGYPGSSSFTTSVGGTDLRLGQRNHIATQVVWSTYPKEGSRGVGTGGGPSIVWPRPGFQRAPGIGPQLQRGRRTRLTPDVSAVAAFKPGLAIFNQYSGWGADGGTSAATPLVAAIVALVDQQERRAGRPRLGLVSPLLYQLGRGRDYRSIFFDITKGTSSRHPRSALGRTPAGGAAQRGYDMATGLGSLNAPAFAGAVASQRLR